MSLLMTEGAVSLTYLVVVFSNVAMQSIRSEIAGLGKISSLAVAFYSVSMRFTKAGVDSFSKASL